MDASEIAEQMHRESGIRQLQEENERLRAAILAALDSAYIEDCDRYRGTDEPREWVTMLRRAVGGEEES